MKALGDISSVAEGRAVIVNSCEPKIFEPSKSA